jgi:hypothetical protein
MTDLLPACGCRHTAAALNRVGHLVAEIRLTVPRAT